MRATLKSQNYTQALSQNFISLRLWHFVDQCTFPIAPNQCSVNSILCVVMPYNYLVHGLFPPVSGMFIVKKIRLPECLRLYHILDLLASRLYLVFLTFSSNSAFSAEIFPGSSQQKFQIFFYPSQILLECSNTFSAFCTHTRYMQHVI